MEIEVPQNVPWLNRGMTHTSKTGGVSCDWGLLRGLGWHNLWLAGLHEEIPGPLGVPGGEFPEVFYGDYR
jgi:hypothetical protein